QPACCRGESQAEHVVSRREPGILQAGDLSNDREAVPRHWTPAIPAFFDVISVRFPEIGNGRVTQLLDSSLWNRGVEPNELNHRAESIAVLKRGDADAVLGKQHRVLRGDRGPSHRHRIAFARFNRNSEVEL